MCVHAGSQAAQIKFTRVVEGHNFTSIIEALRQIAHNLAKLIHSLAIRFRPAPALNPVDPTHIIFAFACRIAQPGRVQIGIGIPRLGAQLAEFCGTVVTAQVAKQFSDSRLPVAFTSRNDRKLVAGYIIGQVRIDDGQASLAGAFIFYPDTFFYDPSAKLEILLHVDLLTV